MVPPPLAIQFYELCIDNYITLYIHATIHYSNRCKYDTKLTRINLVIF